MEQLESIAELLGYLGVIAAAAAPLYKMWRQSKLIKEGMKCLLRSNMLAVYYRHREDKKIRQYEAENFLMLYTAYHSLGGNSFIEEIKADVMTYEVIS